MSLLHGLVAVVLSGLLGIVPTIYPATAPPPVTAARLSVSITMTADWATIAFTPSSVLASNVTSKSAGVKVATLPTGWKVTARPGVTSRVTIDAVVEETTGASSITTSIAKGYANYARVQVVNTTAQPFTAVTLLNNLHRSGVTVQRAHVATSRSSFLGTQNAPFRRTLDPRRLVLAFYYPWFDSVNYAAEPLADRPAVQRQTTVAADVDSMTAQARANGVDGFVVDWQGERYDGQELSLALRSAERLGGVVTAYVVTRGANAAFDQNAPPSVFGVAQRINQALLHANSPAFLHADGVPVLFVYEMWRLAPADWRQVLDGLAGLGRTVRLVGDGRLDQYGGVSWGYHQYNPNFVSETALRTWNLSAVASARISSSTQKLVAATVSPGYDDHLLRGTTSPVVPRGAAGERYEATWRAARAATPDWILVTSWNEWYEGTHIEPGVASGDLALRQTAAESTAFKAA